MQDCLVAFGSNQGNSREIYDSVLELLRGHESLGSVAASDPEVTSPVGGPRNQPEYLNAAIRFETSLSVSDLHLLLINIENQLGRVRKERWGARHVDLDLLLFGNEIINTASLTVPHPRMSFRRFVLEPSVKVASDMIHPISGCGLAELIAILDQRNNVVSIAHPTRAEMESVLEAKADESGSMSSTEGSASKIIASMEAWAQDTAQRVESNWSFRRATNVEELESLEDHAKLVVYFDFLTGDGLSTLAHRAMHFAGPTLRLPVDVNLASTELNAAIESMGSLKPNQPV